ncbi:LysM peptidoglycan-binding domain-containing protein [Olleya sp. YS]|uniref:LysM peptidoglycan-binding domain-containing protein n=1 Tax=Olleya sp. YS TaxID=3028318 RepID=UPI0024340E16|nr:LysM peptidoglycan-binding domain-containing protein [Olleya sp. YS]WGD34048.1 LysM peptidoglycan-binding domain-containing protein [Olleya sp. YS]
MRKLIYILSLVVVFGCASAKAQNYKTHKVKAGETIEQIATRYNVSKSQIYALNPDARKEIKPNSVLIIPKENTVATTSPSTKITRILDGFKTHKVRRKETLYSLSKKYDVKQEDIKKHNPQLYANNLRKGDKIKIPIYKTITEQVVVKPTTKTYTVKPKEGKWRIAYQYGITVQELEDLNPNMAEVLQPGDVVNVPNLDKEDVKQIDEQYSYYTVLPAEGFYRLKLKTGLTQEQLEQLNPGLETTGLKEGMVLKIPFNATLTGQNSEIEGGLVSGDTITTSDLSTRISDRSTKHIAIMLPFKLNKIDSDSIYDAKQLIRTDPYISTSLDFYSGVKIALDSLASLGINLKVDVYDTENRESRVASLVRSNTFDDVDVVIGPVMPKLFNTAAAALKSKNIPLVSPITKTVNLGDNVFQSRPAEKLLKDKIVNYFKTDSTSHFIIVSDMKNKATSDLLKRTFPKASVVMSRKVAKTGADAYYILDQDIVNVLKPGKNVVFLETANAGFVSNVSSILNSKIDATTSVILATTDKTKAFEDDEVRNTHLSNLSFTYASINKSFSEDESNSFNKRYMALYKESPNPYAVRGFDLTMDVVLRLVTSEDLYLSVNESPLTSYVENKFAYKKKLFGGYYNDTVYLVKYQDLKIVEIKQ